MLTYQLSQNGDAISSHKHELNNLKDWVRNFAPSKCPEEHFKLISSKVSDYDFTHAGLIYYLHGCWAKELGCVIKPDMIFQTILSELTSSILNNPKAFKFLFMEGDTKKNLILETTNADKGEFDINKLSQILNDVVVNKDFYDIVCNTKFTTDGKLGHHVRLMTFANMGVPFFNYMSTMCGISSVSVDGSKYDWEKLTVSLIKIQKIFQNHLDTSFNKDNEYYITKQIKYLDNSIKTISSILHYSYDSRYKSHKQYSSAGDFYNDIFHYGENVECDSGHDEYVVSGWIRNFYKTIGEDLSKFSPSLCYVPYKNIETNKNFIQVAGLTNSKIKNGVAYPEYNKLSLEVLDQNTFNKLAHQGEHSSFQDSSSDLFAGNLNNVVKNNTKYYSQNSRKKLSTNNMVTKLQGFFS